MQVPKEGSSLVFWNCELDTLRADLGQPFFPPKSVHYAFLATCKPVFYIRQRDYSKTVNVAPFIINYSGCLFREFPGPWQVMLRQDGGEYACVAEDVSRCTPVILLVPVSCSCRPLCCVLQAACHKSVDLLWRAVMQRRGLLIKLARRLQKRRK
jgi:hypothetical protein